VVVLLKGQLRQVGFFCRRATFYHRFLHDRPLANGL
jgi:hypothetical protein